ncbi:pyridoxamine 5'-phosphate oxidase family protein [Marinibaculum pumilum]|uniref:Pyridoxamine 5'-phosphate oxidase family protein n=1 Tax=Marinibaculum pumilum TaxID=1766165 RepID=A0ABV7L5C7_9PROT
MLPQSADDLDGILDAAWRLLAAGAAGDARAWNRPALATVRADGAPSVRTVVLRAVDAQARCLRLHTDSRSAKVAELGAEPRSALHVYDAGAAIQLRLDGAVSVHRDGGLVDGAWAASRLSSRICYRVEPGPGTPIPAPEHGHPPAGGDPDAGRGRFAVLLFAVTRLEWLYLGADGHRRAAFDWPQGRLSRQWLVP